MSLQHLDIVHQPPPGCVRQRCVLQQPQLIHKSLGAVRVCPWIFNQLPELSDACFPGCCRGIDHGVCADGSGREVQQTACTQADLISTAMAALSVDRLKDS
jgi:hypothetical protein